MNRTSLLRPGSWFTPSCLSLLLTLLLQPSLSANENWPQWRGPQGNGSSDSTGLPTAWGPDTNILWKQELPSWSGSTPVVWGGRVFLTSPSKAAPSTEPPADAPGRQGGRRGGRGGGGGVTDPGGSSLLLLCLSKTDGKILWEHKLDEGNRMWNKGNNTSPSPVTDGQHVWVVTGNGVVTALDFAGKEIWKRNLQTDYGRFGHNWGYGSSPLLVEGKLIIEVLHGQHTDDPSYVVALETSTGKPLWRRERPTDARSESPDAYTTPALLTHGGEKQFVISGGDYVTGHRLDTGEEIWRSGGLNPRSSANYRIVASPVVHDGIIFAPTRQRPLLALRAGGKGDITTSHLAWKWDEGGGPDVPSPLSDGKYFYMIDDRGLVTVVEAATGKKVYGPEGTAPGTVSSSPVLADGKIYITNEQGITSVIAAGPEFKQIATNPLDGSYTLSSIAVAGRQIFIRTATHLYCIGQKP